MPHFNADNAKTLQEPVTFEVKGKTFTVAELTDDLMAKVEAYTDEAAGDARLSEILRAQLGLFTDSDPAEFEGVPIRTMAGIIDWIQETITDPRGRAKAGKRPRR